MTQERNRVQDVIELTLIPGVGSLAQGRIRETCPDISDLFSMSVKALESAGIAPEACDAIAARRYRPMAEEILDWGNRQGCGFLVRGSTDYPALLSEIHDPPLLLYARGNREALHMPAVSIVGTRKPTYYGLQMAEGLARDLAEKQVVVVSGLARGIDAAAHRGCIEGSGATVAVLGCGIDVVYPREHGHLTNQIIKKGLLLSEFAPGTSPAPQNFPVRNRIISGVSIGTVIVEASEYSGSLITARLAMEQNREVFALPGNLTSPQSFGPNFLIKQGAKLVQSWRDVVEEFPPDLRAPILSREDITAAATPPLEFLTDHETRLLGILETDQAIQFDRLFRLSGLGIPQLSDLLLNLEMKGLIRQVPGNLYLKVAKPFR
jgi:DNA processing protein